MIKKYRRKEYIISAVRWLGEENCEEVFAFLGLEQPDDELDHTHIHFDNPDGGIDTAEIGDWIITDGKRAGHSVCKDIWFRVMFEEEEPGPTTEELLALATVLEIPRPGHALPLQLRRSYGYADRWAICDREGRRWHREYGWVMQDDGSRYEAERDASRYTLAEAVPIARMLTEGQPVQAECANCKGSGLDPRHNGEFVCPDCASAETEDEPVVEPYCDGFPDTCPNKIEVAPAPPHHGGGIRCGCYDDTLPQWLYQRFACPGQPAARIAWDLLDESIRSYWKHTAEAVRRAVARDGFKEQT